MEKGFHWKVTYNNGDTVSYPETYLQFGAIDPEIGHGEVWNDEMRSAYDFIANAVIILTNPFFKQ